MLMAASLDAARRDPSTPPLRRLKLGSNAATFEYRPDGAILVRPRHPLGDYPVKLADRLLHFAREAPERVFIAERDERGEWRKISYAEALGVAKAIGAGLLARG